jgi:uncharacterized protein YjbJ (UPF0337 family)
LKFNQRGKRRAEALRGTQATRVGRRRRHFGRGPDRQPPPRHGKSLVQAASLFNPLAEQRMNRDQVKGRVDQAKGKIKEEAGDLTDNRRLENEGRAEKIGGRGQADYGDAKEKLKDSLDKR